MRFFVTGGSGFIGRHLLLRLLAEGHTVHALARSEETAGVVEAVGATPVRGDLLDLADLVEHLHGRDVFVHAAALTRATASVTDLERVNVRGTLAALEAARRAGIGRFVHVSSGEVLAGGRPVVQADETWPVPGTWVDDRARTRAAAERLVLQADGRQFHTCAVRPRLVWGPGDNIVLPALTAAARSGRWAWVAGGKHLTSTCHVDNVCEGIVSAASYARGGQAYFVTDGATHTYRDFLTRLAATQGLLLTDRRLSQHAANKATHVLEAGRRVLKLKGEPSVAEETLTFGGHEFTVDDSLARRELHYAPVVTVEEGLVATWPDLTPSRRSGPGRPSSVRDRPGGGRGS